jgi:hypothetical protein
MRNQISRPARFFAPRYGSSDDLACGSRHGFNGAEEVNALCSVERVVGARRSQWPK